MKIGCCKLCRRRAAVAAVSKQQPVAFESDQRMWVRCRNLAAPPPLQFADGLKRGQATVEFAVVVAASMLILALIAYLVYDQIVLIGVQKQNAEAQAALSQIAQAAKDVYTQGEGASRSILVSFPSDYVPESSGIMNNSIVLKVRGTYFVENLAFSISGTLPQSSGSHEILLISRGNSVYVGGSLFRMSPGVVSTVIAANTNQNKAVKITNVANESITVNGSLSWPHANVALSVSELNFDLEAYGEKTITISFSASNVSGSYSGTITFNANSSLINDSQALGLYAEIPSQGGQVPNTTKKITVFPSDWNITIARNSTVSQAFTICAINTGISALTSTISHGLPGAWVDGFYTPIPISQDSCTQKTMSITVPLGIPLGAYSGSIIFTGDGAYTETVPLNVVVQ